MGLLQLISPVNSSLIRGSHTNTELDGINDKAAQNSAISLAAVCSVHRSSHTHTTQARQHPPPPQAGQWGGGKVRIRVIVEQIKPSDVAHVQL